MPNIDTKTAWKVATASALCLGMTFVDQSALNVALPSIQTALHLSTSLLHWVVNAYLLTLTIFVVMGGNLGDRLGKKEIFILGTTLFGLSSFCCAMASTGVSLVVWRAFQGIGAALMMPNSSAITLSVFPDDMRGKVMGTLLSFASLLLMIGPILGGILSEYLSWRYIFWINIPLVVVSIAMMSRYAPQFDCNKEKDIDWVGFVLLTLWLFGLVFALMQSVDWGFGSSVIVGSLLGSALCFCVFVVYELKQSHPFIQLRLFQKGTFYRSVFVYAGAQMIFMLGVFIPIYTQRVLGFSPAMAGLLTMPSILPMLFFSRFAGRLRDQYGPRLPMKVGFLILAIGNAWLLLTFWTQHFYWVFIGMMSFAGGAPFIFGNANATALVSVPEKMRGAAAGVTNCCRQLGGTVSMAVLGSVIVMVEMHLPHVTPVNAKNAYSIAISVAAAITTAIAIVCYFVGAKLPVKE